MFNFMLPSDVTATIFGSTVVYPSDSLVSCSILAAGFCQKNLVFCPLKIMAMPETGLYNPPAPSRML